MEEDICKFDFCIRMDSGLNHILRIVRECCMNINTARAAGNSRQHLHQSVPRHSHYAPLKHQLTWNTFKCVRYMKDYIIC
jgi:hypothetical protein